MRSYKKLKKFSLFVICFILIISPTLEVNASTSLGHLDYWNVDSSYVQRIDRWNVSSLTVYIGQKDGISDPQFMDVMRSAVRKWDEALSISLECAYGYQTSLNCFECTHEQLSILFNLPSTFTGYTDKSNSYYEGDWNYNGNTKQGWIINSCNVYVVQNTDLSGLLNTCLHEFGHAMGYYGHSTNANDIMYGYQTSNLELSPNDINHIEQVYHIHTGNDSSYGGCYTLPVSHTHTPSCFETIYHQHTGPTGSCYEQTYHKHTDACKNSHIHSTACYTTHSGYTSSSAKTLSSCPRCRSTIANALVTYNCSVCGYTFGSFLFCSSCGYSGTHPVTSHIGLSCSKTFDYICNKSEGVTIEYNFTCTKTQGVTVDGYNQICFKTIEYYAVNCPYK